MISLRILSTVAALALVVPMAAPTASFAQGKSILAGGGAKFSGTVGGGGGGGRGVGGGGSGRSFGGGGGNWHGGSAGPRFSGSVGGGAVSAGPRLSAGGGNWHGGGGWSGHRHHRGGGFYPGLAIGAIGGAYASSYYGYGPGYYDQGYYDDQYYDDGGTTVEVAPGGGDVAYCQQRFRSYDVRSGTYLGNDGIRHPCP